MQELAAAIEPVTGSLPPRSSKAVKNTPSAAGGKNPQPDAAASRVSATHSAPGITADNQAQQGIVSPKAESVRKRLPSPAVMTIFFLVLIAELAVGIYTAHWYGYMSGDAMSRVANAFYVIHSKTPSLANIGFVWNPLPSFLELVPLLFYPLWPALATSGLAGVIVTSLFAALCAGQLVWAGQRFGLPAWPSVLLTLAYALNPYIFYYGISGLSETIFIYFLQMCVVQFLIWLKEERISAIVVMAFALALAFWTRYEAVPFGIVLALAVIPAVFGFQRLRGRPVREKLDQAGATWVTLLAPAVYSGMLWIFLNYIIMGNPLYFLRSAYSNLGQATLIKSAAKFEGLAGNVWSVLSFIGERVIYFCIPLAAILIIRLLSRRLFHWETLFLLAAALSIPALQFVLLMDGNSAGWIRYYMYPLPIAACWLPYELSRIKRPVLGALLGIAALLATMPVLWQVMNDRVLASDEYNVLHKDSLYYEQAANRHMAAYIAGNLPGEIILSDSFTSFSVIMKSGNPEQFLMTSDAEFSQAVKAPLDYNVEYIIVQNPVKVIAAGLDQIAQAYPGIYEQGTGWTELVQEIDGYWKLYRVKDNPQ